MHFWAWVTVCLLYITKSFAANPIVVISIDGLRPDAINKAKAKNLQNLIKTGTSFDNARTVRPSITLPAHTSMLTGLDPSQHDIIWDIYVPSYGPVRFPTALEIANLAGLHTAIFVAKEKLLHLNRFKSVDHFELTDKEGEAIANAFADYVQTSGLPDVTFLHVPDPDTQGHKFLWMSSLYFNGVRDADKAVGQIIATAKAASKGKEITFIITADHGGFGLNHMADIDENNSVPFIAVGPNITAGLVKHDRVRAYDVGATILSLLGLVRPEGWRGRPVPILNLESDSLMELPLGKPHIKAMCGVQKIY